MNQISSAKKICIHQFSEACSLGDGISNGIFFTQKLLQELGFKSEIYSELYPDELKNRVKPLSNMKMNEHDILLFHFGLGYTHHHWLHTLKARKVMIYHNITPPQFLAEKRVKELSILGRQQLKQWHSLFEYAVGVSEFNCKELRQAQYANVSVLPLLLDEHKFLENKAYADFEGLKKFDIQPSSRTMNILFVGRIMEHKNQSELIDLLDLLIRCQSTWTNLPQNIRLILVGGVTSEPYFQEIKRKIRQLGLKDEVTITGKLSDAELAAVYRLSDVYVSLSQHEGFGMPLIEAMYYDIPVIAKNYAGIAETLGHGGIIFEPDAEIQSIAAQIALLQSEPHYRRHIRRQQRINIQRFNRDHIKNQLIALLRDMDVHIEECSLSSEQTLLQSEWQIEGPYDSSYSLAIVNRELAKALQQLPTKLEKINIGLRSREGSGDFLPNTHFLKQNPIYQAMMLHFEDQQKRGANPYFTLRNCYPPSLNDMQGVMRILSSYGWEETGFPREYVEDINHRLDAIYVVSHFVKKTLRDNGIRIPIFVTGNGVDHLLDIQAQKKHNNQAWKTFRFLHVSSCFPRKGVDVLLKAYGQAFTKEDRVSLIIKTFPNPHHHIQEVLTQLQSQNPQFPHVDIILEDYANSEMKALYEDIDVVVIPSRGEGFGLPIAEAIIFNKPVITTNWSGQLDLVDEATAYLCDYTFQNAQSHFKGLHSAWAEPCHHHLKSLMQELYQSSQNDDEGKKVHQEIQEKVTLAKSRLLAHHKWSDVAQKTYQFSHLVDRTQTWIDDSPIAWITTWNTRCGIASYSQFLSQNFPRNRLHIFANQVDDVTNEDEHFVLRCWHANPEEALEETKRNMLAKNIKTLVVQYNFCFFSLTTLVHLIDWCKEKNIKLHLFFHSTQDTPQFGINVSLKDISSTLKKVDRIYVHGIHDLNHLKEIDLVQNVVYFPQGLLPILTNNVNHTKQPTIAAYGFLLPHKGLQELIKAFGIFRKKYYSGAKLLLINSLYPSPVSDQEHLACRELIEQLGLKSDVTLITDYLSNEASLNYLRKSSIIVYPYQKTQESSSAAVRIGISSGVPIAVTPLDIFDDVKEVVHVLSACDEDSMADDLYELLQNKSVLEEKRLHAHQWVEQRTWHGLSSRLLNMIDGLNHQEIFENP